MANKSINKKILKIWKDYEDKNQSGTQYYPLIYPELKEKSILFVGINPSLRKNKKLKRTDIPEWKLKHKEHKQRIEELKKGEINLKFHKKDIYYDIFKKIGCALHEEWDHIDLFFCRTENQAELKKIIYKKGGKKLIEELNSFGEVQLMESLRLIKKLKPSIIIVTNAFSSAIIKNNELNNIIQIDDSKFEEEGFDRIKNESKTPIIFSGILSGQRALDKESRRRLVWQIGKALEKKPIDMNKFEVKNGEIK
jgi:hypothetical protein